jgi:predicted PurR-regulated permease PerM
VNAENPTPQSTLHATAGSDEVQLLGPDGQPVEPVAYESPHWSNVIKGLVAATAIVLVGILLWRFRALVQPLIFAAILAYLLNPLVNLTMRRFGTQRGTAVLLVYLTFILVALGLLGAVGFVAFSQADRLATALPTAANEAYNWFTNNISSLAVEFGGYRFAPFAGVTDESIEAAIRELASNFNYTQGGTVAANLLGGTISTLSTLFVVMFVAVYLSRDTPLFGRSLQDFAAMPGYRADMERLSSRFVEIWSSYLRGQVLLALSMFVAVTVSLTAIGVNNSLALGGLAALLEFLPVLGPVISALAAVGVAIFQDSNWLGLSPVWYAVLVVVVMFALQQIEGAVLVPRFVGGALDLHPVVVIVVVLMGTSLAGILGAVLAAPVAASVKLLGGYGWRKMWDLPPFPPEKPPEPEPPSLWQRLRSRFGSADAARS